MARCRVANLRNPHPSTLDREYFGVNHVSYCACVTAWGYRIFSGPSHVTDHVGIVRSLFDQRLSHDRDRALQGTKDLHRSPQGMFFLLAGTGLHGVVDRDWRCVYDLSAAGRE